MAILAVALVILLLLVAAGHDLMVRRIPDVLAVGIALAGLLLRIADGPMAIAASLLAALALFAALFAAFAAGVLGGGDVKLATAVAIGLPPAGVWSLVVATCLAGGVLSLLYILAQRLPRVAAPAPRRPSGLLGRFLSVERWRIRRRGPLPYGVAIAAGGILTLVNTASAG